MLMTGCFGYIARKSHLVLCHESLDVNWAWFGEIDGLSCPNISKIYC